MKLRDKFTRRLIKKTSLIGLIVFLTCFTVGEVVCRIIFPVSHIAFELEEFDEKNKMFKTKAGIEGRFNYRNVRKAHFRINNEGWNSTRNYYTNRFPDIYNIYRIATIGASGTEARQVNVESAYPKVIEDTLLSNGIYSEVYTFGTSGMHLAQALHVTRYIIDKFHPDIIINTSNGGDFLRRTKRYFYYMSVEVDKNRVVREIMPVEESFELRRYLLCHSQLIYILHVKFDLFRRIMNQILKIAAIIKGTKYIPYANRPSKHALALKNSMDYRKKYEIARRYLLNQFKNIQERHGVEVVFILGPWYAASYNRPDVVNRPKGEEVHRQHTKALLEEFSLPYFDLTDVFAEDYKLNGLKYDFLYDRHFNEHGHKVEGVAIASYLMKNGFLTQRH